MNNLLINILISIVIVAVILWAVNTLFPDMTPRTRQLINVIIVIVFLIWLLRTFGMFGSAPRRVGDSHHHRISHFLTQSFFYDDRQQQKGEHS